MEELTILHNKGDHVLQYIRDVYCSKEDSDITLVCDDQVTVKAHKFILGIHSPVFRSVLQNDHESPSCVSLPGTKFEELDVLLNLIYFRKSPDPDYGNNKLLLQLMNTFNLEIPREVIVKQELVEHDHDEINTEEENLEELVIGEKDSEQSETDQSEEFTIPREDIFDMFVLQDKNASLGTEEAKKHKDKVTHFFCNKCRKTFSSDSSLQKHFHTKQHKETKERCNVCSKSFRNEMMLKIHMEEHQEEIIVDQSGRLCCNKCERSFKDIYKLREHKVIHVQGMFSCDHCPSKFLSYHALKMHLKHHDEVVECDQCDKKYRTKFILTEHKLTVHQGLKLKCNLCERGFTGSSNLAKHVQADHIGRRFNCDQCPYSAKKRHELRYHVEALHPTDFSKLYECGDCRYKGYSEYSFKRHFYACRKRNKKLQSVKVSDK